MQEVFKVAARNLSQQKLRTALTLLGVVIGIAAVVALISMGSGLNRSVADQLERLGPDRIIVAPSAQGGSFGPPAQAAQELTENDLDRIKNIRNVDEAIPVLFRSATVKFNGKTASVSVIGVPVEESEKFFSDVQSFDLAEGRNMQGNERSAAVIGPRLEEYFGRDINLRDRLEILGKDVRVVGIMKPSGNQQYDFGIMMPIETLRDITGSPDEIGMILVKVSEDPKGAAAAIESKLDSIHNEEGLFVAITTEQLINQINSVFGVMSLVLIGIASISLLVAGFGIMNTMLMSVIERTRDIGIMKAVGATNRRVLVMFLIESGLVGLIGGIAGTVLGYLVAFGFGSAAIRFVGISLDIVIDPLLIAGVLLFSTIIGMLSGAYPALRAARLDPVEALRYE